jgi:hypothetical protein
METRSKRPRVPFKAENIWRNPTEIRGTNNPNTGKPIVKREKRKTLRQQFEKLGITDEDYIKLGMAGVSLMKFYKIDIVKRKETVNGLLIETVVYPQKILSILYALRGYLLNKDLK